jgi:hypothetical protein
MFTCINCATEFEGDVCPNCGLAKEAEITTVAEEETPVEEEVEIVEGEIISEDNAEETA